MNRLASWFWMAVGTALLSLTAPTGCRLPPDNPPPQETSVTNSVRRWSQGIVLTFQTPPSTNTAALLALCAKKTSGVAHGHRPVIFVIEDYNRLDAVQGAALQASLREGAVLTGTTP